MTAWPPPARAGAPVHFNLILGKETEPNLHPPGARANKFHAPAPYAHIQMTIPSDSLSRIQLLIFDLDGTLVDSEKDLALSVNAVRAQMGLAPLPLETIASYVGQGVTTLIEKSLGKPSSSEDVEKGVNLFLAYYRLHMLDNTRPYPGVCESLEELKNRKMAVLTNKPVVFSRDMLRGLGLAKYFAFIYGGNSFDLKKPDPIGVIKLMDDTGCSRGQTMIVGDSDIDVMTARNAGVWACGVSYGIGSHTLEAAAPDLMVGDLRELVSLLNGKGS